MEPYCAGVDLGSRTTAVCILKGEEIRGRALVSSGIQPEKRGNEALQQACYQAEISLNDLRRVVATGYGRHRMTSDRQVSEISCQARGVVHHVPATRLIIDIGGQDSKAILVGRAGKVIDFFMNDKCAAGTGRFLEMMAHILEIEPGEYGALAQGARQKIELTTTCAVFAESEAISLIASGVSRNDLAGAVCRAVSQRVIALAERIGFAHPVVVTGGVALNAGVIEAIRAEKAIEPLVPSHPQHTAALGAALFARDH